MEQWAAIPHPCGSSLRKAAVILLAALWTKLISHVALLLVSIRHTGTFKSTNKKGK